MKTISANALLGALLLITASNARLEAAGPDGPRNATVLLIRHAEKSESGEGLSPAGEDRARAYIKFFQDLTIQSQPAKPQRLIATADSKGSQRPRLTLEPLGKALGLPVESKFKNKDYSSMVNSMQAGTYDGKTTLVCWHHGDMPDVLRALGADPATVLPGGRWPSDEYDWLIELRYDAEGHLLSAQKIDEHLGAAFSAKEPAVPAAAH